MPRRAGAPVLVRRPYALPMDETPIRDMDDDAVLHWDGHQLTIGGKRVEPGRYRVHGELIDITEVTPLDPDDPASYIL